jgi:hypothetical protein
MAFSDTLLNINDAGSNVNINITKAFPLTGKINDTIVISGQNFFGISSVTFGGGVTGTFSVVDKKSILAQVPTNSAWGDITVISEKRDAEGSFSSFVPFPSITGFSLYTGTSGDNICVEGFGFSGVTGFTFNNLQAQSFNVLSNNKITGEVPSGNTKGKIKFVGQSGVSDISAKDFVLQPIFSSITPSSGQIGSAVTISGLNFFSTTLAPISLGSPFYTVGFSNSNRTGSFKIVDQFSITGLVPGEALSGKLFNFKCDGIKKSDVDFRVLHSAPTLTHIHPSSGKSGQYIFASGTNLYEINRMTFSGDSLHPISPFTLNTGNGRTISFNAPSMNQGTYDLIVSGNYGDTRIVDAFSVLSGAVFSGFNPATGVEGSLITLTGENFYSTSRVYFDNTGQRAHINTALGDYSLSVVLPELSETGINIVVDNGCNLVTGATELRYYLKPRITGFSPTSGSFGDVISVTGDRFDAISGIQIGATTFNDFTVIGQTGIELTLPEAVTDGYIYLIATGGKVQSVSPFNFLTPQPTISGFTPTTGYPGVTEIKLSGRRLDNVVKLIFSGASAEVPDYDFITSGSSCLFATVPTGAVDGRIIVVDNDQRRTRSVTPFTVTNINAPYISGFSPVEGPTGSSVTISGSGIASVNEVFFNGTSASFTIGIDSNGNSNVTGTVPGINPWPQDIQIKLSSPVGSHEIGDYKIYTSEPHLYKEITFISTGLNHPDSGFVQFLQMNNTTGCYRLRNPLGDDMIVSSFVIV